MCLCTVEIPHSCSMAVAPYVILLSDPQKTLKLLLHVDVVSISVMQTCVQKTVCVHKSPTDVLHLCALVQLPHSCDVDMSLIDSTTTVL